MHLNLLEWAASMSSDLRDNVTPADVIAECIVPTTKSVFFLGSFESRVTLFAQQIRALNLADALVEQAIVRPTGRVAIIGGGVAGMTLAAALAVAAPTLTVIDLYDRKEELLHLQRGSRDRYLHPHLYDWPRPNSTADDAGLPILNWHAAPANEVAGAIEEGFIEIRRHHTIINLRLGLDVERLLPAPLGPGCRVFIRNLPKDRSEFYDAVILTIGFGYESFLSESNPSYWSASLLGGPIIGPGNDHVILISGNGDGGLVDFMMAAYNHVGHRQIFDFITHYPGLDSVEALLLMIEERAWTADGSIDLFDEYRRLIAPELPPHMLLDIEQRLRPGVRIVFHTREQHLFRRDTAVLNRFGAFLAILADENSGRNRIRLTVGKEFIDAPPVNGEVRIVGEPAFTPRMRFLRLGAEAKKNLAPFHVLAEEFQARPKATEPRFRPATPALTASAIGRFSGLIPRAETAPQVADTRTTPAVTGHRNVNLRAQHEADGRFSWSGDLALDAIGAAWNDDIMALVVTFEAPPSEAGPLVAALARLCGHAGRCEFRCRDRRRWEDAMKGFSGRALPGPDVSWKFDIVGGPISPGVIAGAPL
ncbi:MAG: hypothetical protein M3M96_06640, partial [Candidatus Eremiobacteraeota bacterium]|nr:hypothetical protein [Candidatus Eremiobacteraeota bacterium]